MPRGPRIILSKSYYHIITRGNNRNNVFRFDIDYFYYLNLITKYKKELPFNLFHYCLMPNHVHMLIQTKKASDFSLFMKKINLAYYHYYKKKYDWVGHFWQGRFKNQPVGKDEYFIQCGKYIELNPVRANLVTSPGQYLYSSYNYYANGEKNNLLTESIFYQDLGKTDKQRYEKYQTLLINDSVMNNYIKKVWGSDNQRYNELKKVKYHRK